MNGVLSATDSELRERAAVTFFFFFLPKYSVWHIHATPVQIRVQSYIFLLRYADVFADSEPRVAEGRLLGTWWVGAPLLPCRPSFCPVEPPASARHRHALLRWETGDSKMLVEFSCVTIFIFCNSKFPTTGKRWLQQ